MIDLWSFVKIITILLILIVKALNVRSQANISQSGDIQIITEDGVMWCDSMVCPENTIKCIATKTTTFDLRHIIRSRKCVAESGLVLKLEEITEPNPYPNHETTDYAEAMVSGNDIYQCTNCNNPYLKEIYELHQYHQNHLTNSMFDYNRRLHHAVQKFQQDINERILMDLEHLFKQTMGMFLKRK